MSTVSLSEFRANMSKHLDETEADRSELIVTRRNREPIVVMPLSELEALRETLHLLSTRANKTACWRRLRASMPGKGRHATFRFHEARIFVGGMGRLSLLTGA